MRKRVLTLLCLPVVMLALGSAYGQGSGASQHGMTARAGTSHGTVGLGTDAPGTNSLGTAQSAGGGGGGQGAAVAGDDPGVKAAERKVDQSLKSICRGC